MSRLSVKLPGLELKNPIMPASGTFGFGGFTMKKMNRIPSGMLFIKKMFLHFNF